MQVHLYFGSYELSTLVQQWSSYIFMESLRWTLRTEDGVTRVTKRITLDNDG